MHDGRAAERKCLGLGGCLTRRRRRLALHQRRAVPPNVRQLGERRVGRHDDDARQAARQRRARDLRTAALSPYLGSTYSEKDFER